ncbi:triacylglycerol lipase [Methylobacterium sp. R2-1]|uniref:esterase/lipase family protein n=1 Tax=Methylobacterium sp. R2-1 TaxID=2587064 RepID=UPI00161091E8|nr:alpha/beta fold hydrolase [Methylobacterium sp. R2-1]MBB2965157.1 pimeloyl-ACP methyl ester carboxylesterase [Methylobacterium sp. R2-1]
MTEGVLLLHGIARRAASLRPLERRLAAEGYATLNLDYPARRLGLADIAETIAPSAATFGAGVSRLHIVTHSMGGLVARVLLARRRPENLGRVVMLGPPNGGSEVADALHRLAPYRRFFGPAGAELVTGRDTAQERLYGPVDFPLGVIAGRRSLYPLASLLLPGPNDGRVTVARTRLEGMAGHIVLPVAHPTMMWNRRVLAETLHFLREGRFGHR